MVSCNKIDEGFLDMMESETVCGTYYVIRNRELNLTGFLGRNMKDGTALFIIQDNGRLESAKKEGWTEDEIWNKVGVLRQLKEVNDMAKFLSGLKGYEMIGDYITGDIGGEKLLLDNSQAE